MNFLQCDHESEHETLLVDRQFSLSLSRSESTLRMYPERVNVNETCVNVQILTRNVTYNSYKHFISRAKNIKLHVVVANVGHALIVTLLNARDRQLVAFC